MIASYLKAELYLVEIDVVDVAGVIEARLKGIDADLPPFVQRVFDALLRDALNAQVLKGVLRLTRLHLDRANALCRGEDGERSEGRMSNGGGGELGV